VVSVEIMYQIIIVLTREYHKLLTLNWSKYLRSVIQDRHIITCRASWPIFCSKIDLDRGVKICCVSDAYIVVIDLHGMSTNRDTYYNLFLYNLPGVDMASFYGITQGRSQNLLMGEVLGIKLTQKGEWQKKWLHHAMQIHPLATPLKSFSL
jgi:hypothetical protein